MDNLGGLELSRLTRLRESLPATQRRAAEMAATIDREYPGVEIGLRRQMLAKALENIAVEWLRQRKAARGG
jgi:hypothetical protein